MRDRKYGKVTVEYPPKSLPEDVLENMPVIVFLPKDITSVDILNKAMTVAKHYEVDERHMQMLKDTRDQFKKWQEKNSEYLKVPDTNSPTAEEIELG